jgi:hypothetical protein
MGPVVGVVAAAQVDLALSLIDGSPVHGEIVTFDGRTDVLRRRTLGQRTDCALCGRTPSIRGIDAYRYGGHVGYVASVVPAPAG